MLIKQESKSFTAPDQLTFVALTRINLHLLYTVKPMQSYFAFDYLILNVTLVRLTGLRQQFIATKCKTLI